MILLGGVIDGVPSEDGPPCGPSTRDRSRDCSCPPGTDEANCGCEGNPTEEEECDVGPCDGKFF